jgi:hypothetical protein
MDLPVVKQDRGKVKTETDKVLSSDTITTALDTVPVEDWFRTWAAGRTIMLRWTSKKVKEVVDKMRLPTVVREQESSGMERRHGFFLF